MILYMPFCFCKRVYLFVSTGLPFQCLFFNALCVFCGAFKDQLPLFKLGPFLV